MINLDVNTRDGLANVRWLIFIVGVSFWVVIFFALDKLIF